MPTSRRTLLGFSLGSLLTSCSRPPAPPPQPAAAAKLALEGFQPKSMMVTGEHPVPRAKFPVIDVHTHVNWVFGRKTVVDPAAVPPDVAKQLDQIVRWMDELNMKLMVNLTGGTADVLKNNIAALDRKYPGRFLNCVEPDWTRIREPGYPQWQAEQLTRAKEAGAVGLKILKTLGLYLRENIKEGSLVKIDDPRFDPMWDAAGKIGLPVFIHTGDPDAFFEPIDRFNERYEDLGNHPAWSFYGKDFPKKAELLAARNRVIAKHPKTTFVGLHVANHPENLDAVSECLRKYPNLHCEFGARLGEMGRQPRRTRKFFEEFPDRIMFGTDATPNGKDYPQQDLRPEMFQCFFRWLETEDEYFNYAPVPVPPNGRWQAYGIGLPDGILKKVYHNNAAKLLGLKQI